MARPAVVARASPSSAGIATACPFCYIMIDDGVKELGQDVPVRDIAQILAEQVFPPGSATLSSDPDSQSD